MLLSWIVIGLVVSLIWKLFWGVGKLLVGILIAVIGAGLGGWLGMLLGIGALAAFGFPNILMAIGGACLFLGLSRMIKGAS